MKIELKKIKHSPSLSQETEAFTADLFINDKLAGYVSNQGHGGNTNYYAANKDAQALISEAEAYCKTLPDKQYPKDQFMEAFSVPMNLEGYIDDLLNAHLYKKDLEKYQKKGIVYGASEGAFHVISFSKPFKDILQHPDAHRMIKEAIVEDIIPKLEEGMRILNTNIPENILKDSGLKEGQYHVPALQVKQEKPEKRIKGKGL